MWLNVKVSESVKKKLDSIKIHPRQSYNEVIENLIEEHDAKG